MEEYLAEGFPPKVAAFMAAQPPPVCDVWAENWPALTLFLAMETQWRLAPSGGYVGLDYAALPAVLELLGIAPDRRRALFGDLRTMENEVLTAALEPAAASSPSAPIGD